MIARTSPIVSLAVRAVTPLALVVAAYVLFAGHNQPGGGFAAGLMLGAVIVLRTVAGIQQPRYATVWMSVGGVVAGVVAIAPMFWGEPLLDQVVVTWDAPVLGTVKTGSALPFDLGVVAIVVGLVIALLDGLDAESLVDRGRLPAPASARPVSTLSDSAPSDSIHSDSAPSVSARSDGAASSSDDDPGAAT